MSATTFIEFDDVQCGRCGSSMYREDCWHLSDDDCDVCDGVGGWWVCLSSPEFCEANPLPGRESVERSTEEWFRVTATGTELLTQLPPVAEVSP